MEIKLNDYVIIKEKINGLAGYASYAQKNKLPLKVYQLNSADSCNVFTDRLSINAFAQNPFIINTEYLELISKENKEKRIKEINKQYEKELKQKLKILKPKRIPINDRKDYSIATKILLNTGYNYINTYDKYQLKLNNGVINDKLFPSSTSSGGICCSLTKVNRDVAVYIPKSWLNYFGYTLIDLKAYFSFLEKCEIGFSAKILGTKALKEIFKTLNDSRNLTAPTGNYYRDINEDCYEILINGHKIAGMVTYLYFILVRFLYSNAYWNIPTIAMKLKKNLPEATHWECLLIAHCNENYGGYYSLVENGTNSLALPSIHNSQKAVLDKLISSRTNMNGAFKKYSENSGTLRTAIREENYKQIQETINKYRNVN